MSNSIHLEGKSVVYAIQAVNDVGLFGSDSSYRFTLATLTSDGKIDTMMIGYMALLEKLKGGFRVENLTIKDNKISLRGDKGLDMLSPYRDNMSVCIAEIRSSTSDEVSYMKISRHGVPSVLSKDNFKKSVSYGIIDNYCLTQDNQLRRYPGQEVAKLISSGSLVVDTYSGMTHDELVELLKNNGFTLGYKSEVYKTKGYWETPDSWIAHAWYDKNGALIFYNAHLEGGKLSPFYGGGNLYVDANVTMSASEQLSNNICMGQCYSNSLGHQRLYIDARENLMQKYRSMLKAIESLNPWDFDDKKHMLQSPNFSRRDYLQKLQDMAYELKGAPSKKEDDMFMYSLYSDIATYYTVQNFKGDLRSIFSSYERNFLNNLGADIARNLIGGVLLRNKDKALVEEYLRQVKIKLPASLDKYIEVEKARQREKQKEREKRMKERQSRSGGYLVGSLTNWFKG